jgi:hypothetical protein
LEGQNRRDQDTNASLCARQEVRTCGDSGLACTSAGLDDDILSDPLTGNGLELERLDIVSGTLLEHFLKSGEIFLETGLKLVDRDICVVDPRSRSGRRMPARALSTMGLADSSGTLGRRRALCHAEDVCAGRVLLTVSKRGKRAHVIAFTVPSLPPRSAAMSESGSRGQPRPPTRRRVILSDSSDEDEAERSRNATPTPAPRAHRGRPIASANRYAVLSSDDDEVDDADGEFRLLRNIVGTSQPLIGLAQPSQVTLDSDPMDGVEFSSPIRGSTKAERKINRRAKADKYRAQTITRDRLEREQQQQQDIAQDEIARAQLAQQALAQRHLFFDGIISSLREHRYTLGDFFLYIFGSESNHGEFRYRSFFQLPGVAERVLDLWVSNENSPTARKRVREWSINYVCKLVGNAARDITRSGFLQSSKDGIHGLFVRSYHPLKIFEHFASTADPLVRVLRAFSLSPRQQKSCSDVRLQKKNAVRKLVNATSSNLLMLDIAHWLSCGGVARRVQSSEQ